MPGAVLGNFPTHFSSGSCSAKLSGAKCYFVNVGAGPLERRLSRWFINRALHLADYVSFRDAKSLALVQEIGFTGPSQVRCRQCL